MAFWNWSKTAANNATADPTINFAEGQSSSSLNDSCRGVMAALASFRDDTNGLLVTGGISTAYTVTTNEGLNATPNNGQFLVITPNATNGIGATLSADGGTAFALQSSPGIAVGAGVLIAGTPYGVTFNAATPAWILNNFYVSTIGTIPIGGIIPFVGTTAPSSVFVLPFGQAISRTTYSSLFAITSTTFGVGDGFTTFNVPDLRGRTPFGLDNLGGVAAGRIGTVVTDSGTITGTTIGSAGGSSTHVQVTGEVGVHTHGITDPGHRHTVPILNVVQGSNVLSSFTPGGATNTSTDVTGITINNSAAPSAMSLLNPSIMLGWILRVL